MQEKFENRFLRREFRPIGWMLIAYFVLMNVFVIGTMMLQVMSAFFDSVAQGVPYVQPDQKALSSNGWGYVLAMLAVILYAIIHRDITTGKHAVLLVSAVIGNIGVWFVEQIIPEDFEFLSISMVLTEVILMMLYGMLRDHQIALEKQIPAPEAGTLPRDLEALFAEFLGNAATLSTAEKRVLRYYIEGYEISEIPELAYISIHTVKKHNRSIYQKLGVASRDDLMLFVELFRRSGRLEELTRLL